MNLGLEGRACVVTGGTRGIGAATARMLSQEGARVLTVARHGADWELDVMAPMRLMRALAPAMVAAGGGRIVNVSSSSGRRPSRRLDASYSVTKAAELSLSRVFADAFAAKGVLVNAVTPGAIDGELWQEKGGLADQIAARTGETRDEVLEATRSSPPLGRMGTDHEVAAVIAFLCSQRASNVAGAAWAVDGGAVPTIG